MHAQFQGVIYNLNITNIYNQFRQTFMNRMWQVISVEKYKSCSVKCYRSNMQLDAQYVG